MMKLPNFYSEPIKAERATVRFFDGLTVDGYRMPSGQFRIGLTGASRILGYNERWLRDTLMEKLLVQLKLCRD